MWRLNVRRGVQSSVSARALHTGPSLAASRVGGLQAAQQHLAQRLQQLHHAAAAAASVAPTSNAATQSSSRLLRPSSGLLLPSMMMGVGSAAGLHFSAAGRADTISPASSAIPSSAPPTSTPTPTTTSSRILTNASLSGLVNGSSPLIVPGGAGGAAAAAAAGLLPDSPEWHERDPRMLDCILVRHGESEGNIAYNRSWEGDHSLYTGAFLKRHSSLWRLTDRGREQARTAGEWLRAHTRSVNDAGGDPSNPANVQSTIYRYYVSEYIRAMETAALMELPEAKWFVEVQLRERDWGTFDIMSQKERVVRFSEETRRRDRDSLFYAPPGGESLVHVLSRVDGVLTNFNRQCANRRCVVVCHGEVMWAFRLRFERLSQLTYREMEAASSPYERIHNCQILWYSRRNPYTGEISKFFKWKRSVCPWDLKRSHNEWEEIVRVEHTNESLAAHVNRVKRIYGHEKSFRASTLQAASAPATGQIGASSSPSSSSSGAAAAAAAARNNTRPPTPVIQDPNIAAEIRNLKVDMPVMAAAAAATTDHPSPFPPAASSASSPSSAFLPDDSRELQFEKAPTSSNTPANGNNNEDAHLHISPASGSATAAAANAPPAWNPAPGWPFLSAHPRVLVLTKTPRYEHEKNSTGLKGQDLHAELSKLGFVSDRLVQSYVRHMEGLAQLTLALQQHSMKVIVKHVDSATHADLEGIDLILSAGGDGTMLKAAALLGYHQTNLINSSSSSSSSHPSSSGAQLHAAPATLLQTDNSADDHQPLLPSDDSDGEVTAQQPDERHPYVPIPLIGVNTDPQHSSGVLCAFSIEGPHTAERVIEHLRKSHFVWVEKSRIEITLIDKSGATTHVGQYAYNDVVVAERDPGRPIVYELTVDDHAAEIQRSSGVLVCTGTGSTAWMANAAGIHPDQVAAVLKDVGHKHSMVDARQIADRLNSELVFESNSPEVQYFVREPLLPLSSAASVGRVGYQHRHGWAGRVAVRSLGWDAVMSIDGINLVQLPKGTTAVLNIGRKPGANLTVLSLAGTGGEPFSRQ